MYHMYMSARLSYYYTNFCETLTWLQYRNIDIREAIYIKKMKHRYIKKENGKSSNWCLST